MAYAGRRQIFTDELVIDSSNLIKVISGSIAEHEKNAIEIDYLISYVKGKHPIEKRVKEIRPEINIKTVFNRAAQIVDFQLNYEFGSPITYVQRSNDNIGGADSDLDDKGVSMLNEMLNSVNKASVDFQIARNFKTCGVGYRLIEPCYKGMSLFKTASLNPETTFVVYQNDAYREPILGVTYFKHTNGDIRYSCYTENARYEVVRGMLSGYGEVTSYPNIIGEIPIIEYINNHYRMSAFEHVMSLIDALNIANSDRLNDIAQHVQSLLWINNADIAKDDVDNFREGGIIKTTSGAGLHANIAYLESILNQSEAQTLVDYINDQIDIIANIPGRQETGGGSTGSAMNLSNGWQSAETSAKGMELVFEESERRSLAVIEGIIANRNNVPDELAKLKISDVDPKFSRNKTYDLATKCSSLACLINIGVDGLTAFTIVGLFTDPQLAWENSKETISALRGSGKPMTGDDSLSIVSNVTEQPSKVGMVDESS